MRFLARSGAMFAKSTIVVVALLPLAAPLFAAPPVVVSSVSFAATDRLLVVAPHPGDEAVVAGGAIEAALARGAAVRVVFLTNGDNAEWAADAARDPASALSLGTVRRDESLAALRALGAQDKDAVFLGYPDGGLLPIFVGRWGNVAAWRSPSTRVDSVPYGGTLRPGAAYRGEEILADLESVIRDFRPTKVIVTHPADESADHRAAYLFARVALWDAEPTVRAELLPALVHFRRRVWPQPDGYRPSDALAPPSQFEALVAWRLLPLSADQVAGKYRALQAHRTVFARAGADLAAFARTNELFGDFFGLPETEVDGHPVEIGRKGGDLLRPSPSLPAALRPAYVAIEERTVYVEGSDLVEKIRTSAPLTGGTALSVFFCGYRHDVPFVEMAKVGAWIDAHRDKDYDGVTPAVGAGVTVTRKDLTVTVRVPLRNLGFPEKVMMGATTSRNGTPMDAAAWQVIEGIPRR